MTINGLKVDVSKGFDVLNNKKILRHFESYEEAREYAGKSRCRCIRYYLDK